MEISLLNSSDCVQTLERKKKMKEIEDIRKYLRSVYEVSFLCALIAHYTAQPQFY